MAANCISSTLRLPDGVFTDEGYPHTHVSVSACLKHGCENASLQLLEALHQRHIALKVPSTYRCTSRRRSSRKANSLSVDCGLEVEALSRNTFLDMHDRGTSVEDAEPLLCLSPERASTSWPVLGAEQLDHGLVREASCSCEQQEQEDICADPFTCVSLLKACSDTVDLTQGIHMHAYVVASGHESEAFVACTLVDMYAKCGSLGDAHTVCERLPLKSVAAWNALIGGYVQHGRNERAVEVFEQVHRAGVKPSNVTFICILKACASLTTLELGKCIHNHIITSGFDSDVMLENSLISMYIRCGSLSDACTLFNSSSRKSSWSWNLLIAGYAEHGWHDEAVRLFDIMQKEGIKPDRVTFLCILRSCTDQLVLDEGRHFHAQIVNNGLNLDSVIGNTLVDMYGKCGSLDDAHAVFHLVPKRDVVTWNALIGGLVQNGNTNEVFRSSKQLQQEGVVPNRVTFLHLLKACACTASLEQGRHFHVLVFQTGYESDPNVGSSLINMYAKCGELDSARIVFERAPKYNVVTWNALIAGFSQHSEYSSACKCFEDMKQAGVEPDRISFICLLSACYHLSLVEEGCLYFQLMRDFYNLFPSVEHYNCMVNLLGNAQYLNEAEDLLETIPSCGNVIGWTSLLTSCRKYTDVVLGSRCFDRLATLDSERAAGYVLMTKIYACAGLQEDANRVEYLRRSVNGWKKPGKAFIEIDYVVHCFNVGDTMHPRIQEVQAKLRLLNSQLKADEGYQPSRDFVMNVNPDTEKEAALCGHCEKLAIAFGLICSPKGMTIRVAKNLRMCPDCHMATKIISKIEMREIIVTDTYCVHQFRHGSCSCKEYP